MNLNRGPSAYQPNTLLLGQTGSLSQRSDMCSLIPLHVLLCNGVSDTTGLAFILFQYFSLFEKCLSKARGEMLQKCLIFPPSFFQLTLKHLLFRIMS